MAADPDDFGERAATAAEVTAWVALTRQARNAARGYVAKETNRPDRIRPTPDSNKASSEGDE